MDYLNFVLEKISNFVSPLGLDFDKKYLDYLLKKIDNDCTIQQLVKVVLENNRFRKFDYVLHVIIIVLFLNKYQYNKSINCDFSLEILIDYFKKLFSLTNKEKSSMETLEKMKQKFMNYDYIFKRSEIDYIPCLLSNFIIESKINSILHSIKSQYIVISSDEIDLPLITNGICLELDNYIFPHDKINQNIIFSLMKESYREEQNTKEKISDFDNENHIKCIVLHDVIC